MAIPGFIKPSDTIVSYYKTVNHIEETHDGKLAHPEFYEAYNTILSYYKEHTPNDPLLEETEERYIRLSRKPKMDTDDTEPYFCEFQGTRFLDVLLSVFPKTYILTRYNLETRRVTSSPSLRPVSDALTPLFDVLGFEYTYNPNQVINPSNRPVMKTDDRTIISPSGDVSDQSAFLTLFNKPLRDQSIGMSFQKNYRMLRKKEDCLGPLELLLAFRRFPGREDLRSLLTPGPETLTELLDEFVSIQTLFFEKLTNDLKQRTDVFEYFLKRATNEEKESVRRFMLDIDNVLAFTTEDNSHKMFSNNHYFPSGFHYELTNRLRPGYISSRARRDLLNALRFNCEGVQFMDYVKAVVPEDKEALFISKELHPNYGGVIQPV